MTKQREYSDEDWPAKPVRAEPLDASEIAYAATLVDAEGEIAVQGRSGLSDTAFARGLAGLGLYKGNRAAWRYFLAAEGYTSPAPEAPRVRRGTADD